jgi:hypothetical protein
MTKTQPSQTQEPTQGDLPFAPHQLSQPFPEASKLVPASAEGKPATAEDVQKAYKRPDPGSKSPSNVTGDPTQNLQNFKLADLAQFTKEKIYSTNASNDVHLFYVGRDDVHDILKYILSRVTISLYLNMFGFDDSELNNILMEKALNPNITMLITLDKSQASGVHEKALLDADQKYNLAAYNTHFVVGQSATHQISHTKGFVADGRVAAEGSTNWSTGGEGTFVVTGQPGGAGYKAQNNTQSVITDPDTITRFQTELISEHMIARSVVSAVGGTKNAPLQSTDATKKLVAQAGSTGTPPAPVQAAPSGPTAGSAPAKKATRKTATKKAAHPTA